MNFCLSDLVPPLRWSDAARIRGLQEPVERDELPDAWWRALPMAQVLTVLDVERLADLLAELSLEHWPAAAVGDILPALHVVDPDEADEPHVAIALDRAGSWAGLLALTGRELLDQPFIQARPVLTALFAAVFARLAEARGTVRERPADAERPAVAPAPVAEAAPAAPPLPGQEAPTPPPATRRREPSDLAALIDAAFADLDDQAWAVAQNRVFTDQPSEVDQLAKLFAVSSERILELEGRLRERLADWLAGPEAAPYNRHLEAVAEVLGAAAPRSRLIDAADWHSRELRSLDVPAWQFVLATLPGYQVAGDWLVAGDPDKLREQTRALILDGARPPTVARAAELVTTLGVPAEVARDWLESVPGLRVEGDAVVAGGPAEDRPEDRGDGARSEAADAVFPEPGPAEPTGLAGPPGPEEPGRRDEAPPRPDALDADLLQAEPAGPAPDRGPAPEPDVAQGPPVGEPPGFGGPPPKALRPPYGVGPIAPPGAPEPPPGLPDPHVEPSGAPVPGGPPGADALDADGPAPAPVPDAGPAPAAPGEPRLDLSSTPSRPVVRDGDAGGGLKDVALTRRCFRQPDGRWWFRVDVTEDHLAGGPCPVPSGFAAYLGLAPGDSRTVRCATGEITLSWQSRPALTAIRPLLIEAGAQVGGHLFVTLSEDGMLRARHLPAASGTDKTAQALRLVGYTAPGGTMDQALRVIATRVGMDGSASRNDLLGRLRERGDRDLLSLLATPVAP